MQRQAGSGKSPKSRKVAALLAMPLGGLGMYKFYLGKGRTGLLYLLFCWSAFQQSLHALKGGSICG